jgi:uncharacterized protein YndB with AHSA1/START domain
MEKTIVNSIVINSTKENIWDALINPSKTKIYMFGCETITDWKIASDLLWEGSYQGQKMVFVKGKVLVFEPHQKLVYTVFDPNSTMDDIPENYLSVTYTLEEKNDGVLFTVTQGDYSKVAEGERRYQESYNNEEGWNPILVAIKKLVEEEK